MLKRTGPALIAAVLLLAPAQASAKDCGNYPGEDGGWTQEPITGAGIFNVMASASLPCATARRVAKNAYRDYDGSSRTWIHRGFWRCRILIDEYEYTKSRCRTPGGRRVVWESGA